MCVDDNKIVNLFFARDESAISETRQKYGAYLFTVATNILCNAQDGEECVSDTYLKVWEAIPPKRPSFLKCFLAKITRNRALDMYRTNSAKKRGNGNFVLLLDELSETIPSAADVHTSYENNITAQQIDNFLRDLNEETRFVFMRRYWYADPISTIAKGCRISESKVKSMLLRTRRKLKEFLED